MFDKFAHRLELQERVKQIFEISLGIFMYNSDVRYDYLENNQHESPKLHENYMSNKEIKLPEPIGNK